MYFTCSVFLTLIASSGFCEQIGQPLSRAKMVTRKIQRHQRRYNPLGSLPWVCHPRGEATPEGDEGEARDKARGVEVP